MAVIRATGGMISFRDETDDAEWDERVTAVDFDNERGVLEITARSAVEDYTWRMRLQRGADARWSGSWRGQPASALHLAAGVLMPLEGGLQLNGDFEWKPSPLDEPQRGKFELFVDGLQGPMPARASPASKSEAAAPRTRGSAEVARPAPTGIPARKSRSVSKIERSAPAAPPARRKRR